MLQQNATSINLASNSSNVDGSMEAARSHTRRHIGAKNINFNHMWDCVDDSYKHILFIGVYGNCR